MFLGIVAFVVGGALMSLAFWHGDEERRARGRGRVNSILTEYGGGSFGEGISSMFSELSHACLSKVFFVAGIACLIFAIDSCSGNDKKEYEGPRRDIKEFIDKQEECRIVAITKNGGDVAVAHTNTVCANSACPSGLCEALVEIKKYGYRITDICLTDAGRYVVLYGKNGYRSKGLPQEMSNALHTFHDSKEELYSATVNDKGEWAVVSDKHFNASSDEIRDWLIDGVGKHGQLLSVSITDDAQAAVFANGWALRGNCPKDLEDALQKIKYTPRIIRMAGEHWFFANETGGRFNYFM